MIKYMNGSLTLSYHPPPPPTRGISSFEKSLSEKYVHIPGCQKNGAFHTEKWGYSARTSVLCHIWEVTPHPLPPQHAPAPRGGISALHFEAVSKSTHYSKSLSGTVLLYVLTRQYHNTCNIWCHTTPCLLCPLKIV